MLSAGVSWSGDCKVNGRCLTTSGLGPTPIEVDASESGHSTMSAVMFQAFRRLTGCEPGLNDPRRLQVRAMRRNVANSRKGSVKADAGEVLWAA